MKRVTIGTNLVIFLLFFGVGLLEAIQSANWGKATFWVVIGIVFLVADNFKQGGGNIKSDK